jgi:hypothetical protein
MPITKAQLDDIQSRLSSIAADVAALTPDSGNTGGSLGTFTQFPLPTSIGSTYGVNYFGYPFRTNGSSKQADICYCPLNGRIYAQGGDVLGSATDGTWSFDATTGNDWKLEVGQPAPVYPNLVAPHGLQEDYLFEWIPEQNEFIMCPGGGFYPYPEPIDFVANPVQNLSHGIFYFNPTTKTYRQDLRLFSAPYSNNGSYSGGGWDPVNRYTVAFGDTVGKLGKVIRRYDVVNGVQLTDVAYVAKKPVDYGTVGASYASSSPRPARIGRNMYFLAEWFDGVSLYVRNFFVCNLDTLVVTQLADPPNRNKQIVFDMTHLQVSNGKVVWFEINGPDGAVSGIFVYDPMTNTWSVESAPLPVGFMGNVQCSLPDGRVALAGGVFGAQQTMFNFYSVN